MARYKNDDELDLLGKIKLLEERISRLERTPQLPNAASNRRGFILVDGGFMEVRLVSGTDDEMFEQGGFIAGPVFVQGQEGTGISFYRSTQVESISPGGELTNAVTQAFNFNTIEGEDEDKFTTWALADKSGHALVSDSLNARQGFNHPRLSVPWNSPTFTSSTSATFAEMANWEWYTYAPHLRVRLLLSNDGGNVSEARVVDFSTGTDITLATLTSTSGAVGYFDIIVKRSACAFGLGTNGTAIIMRLDHRRVSGAGTIRTRVVSIIGIDLSHTDEW